MLESFIYAIYTKFNCNYNTIENKEYNVIFNRETLYI